MLVIALCKGRFLEPSLATLARADIRFTEDVASSRKLIFDSEDKRFRAVLVKPADVPTYVEYGAADVGIAGRDVIMESSADLLQPLDLNFGHCKIAVAAPAGKFGRGDDIGSGITADDTDVADGADQQPSIRAIGDIRVIRGNSTVRVATKYPRITMDFYNARGIPVEIIPLSGSIELAPLIGLADRIVDLVETGRTLKENGLEIIEIIANSSARLLINRAGYQTKRKEVLALISALEKVVQCESSI